MKKPLFFILLLLFSISSVLAQGDLNHKLRLTREVLTRPSAVKFLSEILWEDLQIKEAPDFKLPRGKYITETQMLVLLDHNKQYMDEVEAYIQQVSNEDAIMDSKAMAAKREKWKEKFREILSDEKLRTQFRSVNNPLEPYCVGDAQSYSDAKTFVNHKRMVDGKMVQADDLKQVWIDEIRKANKEIAVNVFDFDLEDVADELIAAQKRRVSVKVGIDAGVIKHRESVALVFKKLKKGGVFVHAVESVGLNHQKMMAIDWTVPKDARVVLSSGNLTQSCLGPEGDLKQVAASVRSPKSVPNANHVITMKSDAIANVVHHEISKTIDPGFQLKGKQYPVGGAFKFWGGPKTLGADRPYIMLAFTPNGGLDDINQNVISQMLLRTRGPVKFGQFAYSSQVVNDALLKRASLEIAEGNPFVFKSVGDTPFAMMEWSQFLKMSGLELIRDPEKVIEPKYLKLKESEWEKLLGKKNFEAFKSQIKIAPAIYGNHHVKVGGENLPVSSKIHHKLILSGPDGKQVVIAGSFNVSAGAESNQEYILMIKDQKINKELNAAVEQLHVDGKQSVYKEALSRNLRRNFDDAIAISEIEKSSLKSGAAAKRVPTGGTVKSVKGKGGTCLLITESLKMLK